VNAPRYFRPIGPLALEPSAFGMLLCFSERPATKRIDEVAIVPVRGPLMQYADPFCDSYEAIVARVLEAISTTPRAIVLSISSPGGLVAGCFEAADLIAASCKAAGVPLWAFVDGQATSAAYALASVAERLVVPPTGIVGSIGVIAELTDASALDAAMGLRVSVIASGPRKLDGNPHAPTTEAAVLTMQAHVDELAERFFEHVDRGARVSADSVRALGAGLLIGAAAVAVGLADEVGSLETMIRPVSVATEGNFTMSKMLDEAVANLRKMAESDDPKEAAKAKRMLAAELADDAPPANEPDGDEAPAKDEAKAEAPPPFPPKKDDDEAKATSARLAAVESTLAAQARAAVALERASLLAGRPDFSAEHLATLATAPIELVRAQCSSIPRGLVRNPAAAASATGTRGEGQGDGNASRLDPVAKAALDAAMGLSSSVPGVVNDGNRLVLGGLVPR